MKTIYKVMLCTRTNKYRIMVYTPIATNNPVRYAHVWTDDNDRMYNMQWLQTANSPLSIVQYENEELATIVVEDLQHLYNMDNYVEVSCSKISKEND